MNILATDLFSLKRVALISINPGKTPRNFSSVKKTEPEAWMENPSISPFFPLHCLDEWSPNVVSIILVIYVYFYRMLFQYLCSLCYNWMCSPWYKMQNMIHYGTFLFIFMLLVEVEMQNEVTKTICTAKRRWSICPDAVRAVDIYR